MKKIPIRHIASNNKDQNNTGRFTIRDIQTILGGNELNQAPHKHDFFFILAVERGKGVHEIDFIKYEIRNNGIFILRPGQVHQLQLNASSSGYLMEFDTAFYQPKNNITNQRWKKSINKNFCEVEAGAFSKMSSILKNIFDEYTLKQEGYIEAIKANLDLFFIAHLRQSRKANNTSTNTDNYIQERFENFMALLEKNIGRLNSASKYADLLNLSSYQLNAITKTSVGKTVSDLINEQIILEAKRYLLATPNQIKDIADHLGYEDVSYFIRFFKKHTGYSPEQFRQNFK
ncbi:MAG: AraC family transcriptional regulator [Bacteroidetes bacterium]|nr:AraC family transcriptional regulator [Bacteroidota bacterium]